METFDIQNLIYFGKHKIVIVYHFSTMGRRTYRQASYLSRTKSQNLNISSRVLHFSLRSIEARC